MNPGAPSPFLFLNHRTSFMKTKILLTSAVVFLAIATTFATLDIVQTSPEMEEPVYVLKNTDTGKIFGTFWDRANDKSDYGFESSISPTFVWSPDRAYVAVGYGNPRATAVCLYRVVGNSLKEVAIPALSTEQSEPIDAIADTAATGTDIVRWQSDGTLLLRFWAAEEVKSEDQVQREPSVWADVEVNGDKASIVGTSTMEPSAPPAGMFPNPAPPAGETLATQQAAASAAAESFSPDRLVGVHPVTGKNPDGTTYQGTAEIRVVNGVVGIEWKIGKTISHGQGLMVGQTLGIALDDGLAIYRFYGQSEGQSLIGVWSGAGSEKTNHEAILIGDADMTQATADPVPINGKFVSLREVADGQIESSVTISGGENAKVVRWTDSDGKTTKCQGLALGEALAVLTPTGLSVLTKHVDDHGGVSFVGRALSRGGQMSSESFIPEP